MRVAGAASFAAPRATPSARARAAAKRAAATAAARPPTRVVVVVARRDSERWGGATALAPPASSSSVATKNTTRTRTRTRAVVDDAADGFLREVARSTGGGNGGGDDDDDDDDDDEKLFGLPRAEVGEPLAVLLASQFVLFLGVGALLPALPLYAQNIGLSGSANGIVLSAPALAMLLLNLPAGKLVDSWGRKQMMVAGMLIIAFSDLATSQCRSVTALVPARLALGVGRAGAENGDRAYLADLTDRFPSARGTMSGAQQAVQALGLVIGPLVGGRVAESTGDAASVFFLISGAAFACTAGYSLLPDINVAAEREEEYKLMSMDMTEDEEEEFLMEREEKKAAGDWRTLLRSNRQRVITFAAAANALGFVAKLTCIPWFATAALGATPQQVGELFSITALLGMASAPISGVVADKIGLKSVLFASLLACAVGLGFAQHASDVRELQLWIGLWGMGTAAAGPAVNALAQESAPAGAEGEALTLPKTAGDVVFLVGPVALGLADDLLGSEGASLALVSATAAASAVATLAFLSALGEEEGEKEVAR